MIERKHDNLLERMGLETRITIRMDLELIYDD